MDDDDTEVVRIILIRKQKKHCCRIITQYTHTYVCEETKCVLPNIFIGFTCRINTFIYILAQGCDIRKYFYQEEVLDASFSTNVGTFIHTDILEII